MRFRLKRGGILLFAAVLVFFIAIGVFVGVFYWRGRAFATVSLGKRYFFLVRDCESTTAGAVAGGSYAAGGAGYLLERENVVILACYYSKTDAEFVQSTMQAKGIETRILERETRSFSLNGKAAAEKERIAANGNMADSLAHILYDTANDLERAALTQEAARAAVVGVSSALNGLIGENGEGVYAIWNVELRRAQRRAREIAEGIIFAKDLRYLQVQLLISVLNLSDYFS